MTNKPSTVRSPASSKTGGLQDLGKRKLRLGRTFIKRPIKVQFLKKQKP